MFINKNVLYKYIHFIMYLYITYSIQGREWGLEVELGVTSAGDSQDPTSPHARYLRFQVILLKNRWCSSFPPANGKDARISQV